MAKMEYKSCTYNSTNKPSKLKNKNTKYIFYKILVGLALIGIWQLTAMHYDKEIILPYPKNTAIAFFHCITSIEIVTNILITLGHVLKGFLWSLALGLPLGFLMGSFPLANELISWIVYSVRQVPIMAWVPLTIVWFGIGDGPTIFLIAFSGIFPIILNTIHCVKSISKDYYNAARSMGAGHLSIFKNIVIPASIPDILTGSRLAISTGWMSVI
ncbi:ABC transporter permease [Clostridium sp. FP1]|nr:ABC transporter permease [Clostridium sp. FP1]